MSITLKVRDETATGQTVQEFDLDFLTERITIRELLRGRVYQEVKDHNVRAAQSVFCGLVQPTDAERELNGFRLRQPRRIDWQKQFEIAQEAFERNGFLILIDDHQAESLEEEIEIKAGARVSFVKLTPLVGG